jgi:hypothetical protein
MIMSLDLEIRALLQTSQVQEINFTMRGIRVTGLGFAVLSTHFSDQTIPQRIRVTVRPELVGPLDDALYDSREDKINLRSDTVLATAVGRSHVVHECTHAQIDLRGRGTAIRSEEGAAFIAEAWYLLACGMRDAKVDGLTSPEIRTIASSLRSQAQTTGGVAEVSADQINIARRVMVGFGYRSGHYLENGLGGHVFRGE